MADFMIKNQIWLDAFIFERSQMKDLLELCEMVNGRIEFVPNYWIKDDPNF